MEYHDAEAGQTYIYPTNFPIRDYQFYIIKKALFQNTLVCLPTGLGKTFIGAVLMYNFYRWYPFSKVVFLAPTKPLVSQQIEACFNVMGIPQEHTIEMTGSTPPDTRKKIWNEKRIFFLTPQVIMNDLTSQICPVHLISLVVFDEAHKALGNHAYCQVIKLIKEKSNHFRVLALSATPGSDLEAIQKVMVNLLISHIEVRDEDSLDTRPYTFNRTINKIVIPIDGELKRIKDLYMNIVKVYLNKLINNQAVYTRDESTISKFQLLKARESYRQRGGANGDRRLQGLMEGTFALCITLYHALELLLMHGVRSFFTFLKSSIDGSKNNFYCKMELTKNGMFQNLMKEIERNYANQNSFEAVSVPSTSTDTKSTTRPSVQNFSHPKMQKLEEVILNHFHEFKNNNETTRVIVFSQYRESVHEIHSLLQRHEPLIKPMCFVGQSNKAGRKNSQKEQIRVVKQFRNGGYNTLVATCIGEEGLDIGEVDLIICYDAPKSPTRLVQRMGRTGRKRSGSIIILVTEGKEEQAYKTSQQNRKSILKILTKGDKLKPFLYKQSPRMVAPDITPVCLKMKMMVREFNQNVKQMKYEHSSTSKPASKKNAEYLNENERKLYNRDFKVENFKFAFSKPSLCANDTAIDMTGDSDSPTQVNDNGVVDLALYQPWYSTAQPFVHFGHSAATRNLIKLTEFLNLQQVIGDNDNYGMEMAPFLDRNYLLKEFSEGKVSNTLTENLPKSKKGRKTKKKGAKNKKCRENSNSNNEVSIKSFLIGLNDSKNEKLNNVGEKSKNVGELSSNKDSGIGEHLSKSSDKNSSKNKSNNTGNINNSKNKSSTISNNGKNKNSNNSNNDKIIENNSKNTRNNDNSREVPEILKVNAFNNNDYDEDLIIIEEFLPVNKKNENAEIQNKHLDVEDIFNLYSPIIKSKGLNFDPPPVYTNTLKKEAYVSPYYVMSLIEEMREIEIREKRVKFESILKGTWMEERKFSEIQNSNLDEKKTNNSKLVRNKVENSDVDKNKIADVIEELDFSLHDSFFNEEFSNLHELEEIVENNIKDQLKSPVSSKVTNIPALLDKNQNFEFSKQLNLNTSVGKSLKDEKQPDSSSGFQTNELKLVENNKIGSNSNEKPDEFSANILDSKEKLAKIQVLNESSVLLTPPQDMKENFEKAGMPNDEKLANFPDVLNASQSPIFVSRRPSWVDNSTLICSSTPILENKKKKFREDILGSVNLTPISVGPQNRLRKIIVSDSEVVRENFENEDNLKREVFSQKNRIPKSTKTEFDKFSTFNENFNSKTGGEIPKNVEFSKDMSPKTEKFQNLKQNILKKIESPSFDLFEDGDDAVFADVNLENLNFTKNVEDKNFTENVGEKNFPSNVKNTVFTENDNASKEHYNNKEDQIHKKNFMNDKIDANKVIQKFNSKSPHKSTAVNTQNASLLSVTQAISLINKSNTFNLENSKFKVPREQMKNLENSRSKTPSEHIKNVENSSNASSDQIMNVENSKSKASLNGQPRNSKCKEKTKNAETCDNNAKCSEDQAENSQAFGSKVNTKHWFTTKEDGNVQNENTLKRKVVKKLSTDFTPPPVSDENKACEFVKIIDTGAPTSSVLRNSSKKLTCVSPIPNLSEPDFGQIDADGFLTPLPCKSSKKFAVSPNPNARTHEFHTPSPGKSFKKSLFISPIPDVDFSIENVVLKDKEFRTFLSNLEDCKRESHLFTDNFKRNAIPQSSSTKDFNSEKISAESLSLKDFDTGQNNCVKGNKIPLKDVNKKQNRLKRKKIDQSSPREKKKVKVKPKLENKNVELEKNFNATITKNFDEKGTKNENLEVKFDFGLDDFAFSDNEFIEAEIAKLAVPDNSVVKDKKINKKNSATFGSTDLNDNEKSSKNSAGEKITPSKFQNVSIKIADKSKNVCDPNLDFVSPLKTETPTDFTSPIIGASQISSTATIRAKSRKSVRFSSTPHNKGAPKPKFSQSVVKSKRNPVSKEDLSFSDKWVDIIDLTLSPNSNNLNRFIKDNKRNLNKDICNNSNTNWNDKLNNGYGNNNLSNDHDKNNCNDHDKNNLNKDYGNNNLNNEHDNNNHGEANINVDEVEEIWFSKNGIKPKNSNNNISKYFGKVSKKASNAFILPEKLSDNTPFLPQKCDISTRSSVNISLSSLTSNCDKAIGNDSPHISLTQESPILNRKIRNNRRIESDESSILLSLQPKNKNNKNEEDCEELENSFLVEKKKCPRKSLKFSETVTVDKDKVCDQKTFDSNSSNSKNSINSKNSDNSKISSNTYSESEDEFQNNTFKNKRAINMQSTNEVNTKKLKNTGPTMDNNRKNNVNNDKKAKVNDQKIENNYKKKEKSKNNCNLIETEAEVADESVINVSSDESESNLDDYDSSFVDEFCATQKGIDMKAIYLKSVRSPKVLPLNRRKSRFTAHNPSFSKRHQNRRIGHHNDFRNPFPSTSKTVETDCSDFENSFDSEAEDSFVVDNDFVEYESQYQGESMLAIDPLLENEDNLEIENTAIRNNTNNQDHNRKTTTDVGNNQLEKLGDNHLKACNNQIKEIHDNNVKEQDNNRVRGLGNHKIKHRKRIKQLSTSSESEVNTPVHKRSKYS